MNKYQEALDEAIQHCNDVVNEKRKELNVLSNHPINKLNVDYDIKRCIQCKDEHWQLKKWLEELKILRNLRKCITIHLNYIKRLKN